MTETKLKIEGQIEELQYWHRQNHPDLQMHCTGDTCQYIAREGELGKQIRSASEKPAAEPAAPEPSYEWEPLLADLTHTRSCEQFDAQQHTDCTCGLRWRVRLRTEMELRNAWEKRGYQAEAELATLRQKLSESIDGAKLREFSQRMNRIAGDIGTLWGMEKLDTTREANLYILWGAAQKLDREFQAALAPASALKQGERPEDHK